MAKVINLKLSGSTLIEVLIALVIIMVMFALSIGVFMNVNNSGPSYRQIQIHNQLDQLCKITLQKGFITTEKIMIDGVNYELTSDIVSDRGFSQLTVKAVEKDKVLEEMKCLFKLKEYQIED